MQQEIHFGLKIKKLIDLKKETFEESGKRVGVTKSTVNRWTRQKDLGTDVLKQVCAAYGVSMSYFLSESTSYVQKDNIINAGVNAVGEKIMSYVENKPQHVPDVSQSVDYKLLAERLNSCEEQNKLLRDMVAILKTK